MSPSQVLAVSFGCKASYRITIPFVYRNVNLLDLDSFESFETALASRRLEEVCIGEFVQTLQMSFSVGGNLKEGFLDRCCRIFEALPNLRCLNLTYSHFDEEGLAYLKAIAPSFPGTLKMLHLKPISDEGELWDPNGSEVCSSESSPPSAVDLQFRIRTKPLVASQMDLGVRMSGPPSWQNLQLSSIWF